MSFRNATLKTLTGLLLEFQPRLSQVMNMECPSASGRKGQRSGLEPPTIDLAAAAANHSAGISKPGSESSAPHWWDGGVKVCTRQRQKNTTGTRVWPQGSGPLVLLLGKVLSNVENNTINTYPWPRRSIFEPRAHISLPFGTSLCPHPRLPTITSSRPRASPSGLPQTLNILPF